LFLLCSLPFGLGRVYFSETFGEGWESRWIVSRWKDSEKEKMGKWGAATGKWFRDAEDDRGLQTAQIMKFYAIAAPFDSFSNEGKDLIVQYQVKYEKDLVCGGGYLKIGPKLSDLTAFGETSPYNIMFGPDQCNSEKRTHLIFNHKGKNHLKTSELPFKQEGEGFSHVYRLTLMQNGTVRVEVDQEMLFQGTLADDWGLLPPRDLPDPSDSKPDSWIDETMMDDPTAVKPANWVDEKRIPDAESSKPAEWDDDEDGEWEAPKIDNPAYKGEWVAQRIKNPAYIGAWEARRIPNPEFVDSPELYKYSDFGYVGFDVWQVKGGTIFDNIIIADSSSLNDVDAFAAKWKALHEVEQSQKKKEEEALAAAFERGRAARAARAAKAAAAKAEGSGSSSSDVAGSSSASSADSKSASSADSKSNTQPSQAKGPDEL